MSMRQRLHARGVRLVRGIDYSELLKVPYAGTTPTEAEFDAYAKELLTKFVDDLGIDGLDIDMETRPSEKILFYLMVSFVHYQNTLDRSRERIVHFV